MVATGDLKAPELRQYAAYLKAIRAFWHRNCVTNRVSGGAA